MSAKTLYTKSLMRLTFVIRKSRLVSELINHLDMLLWYDIIKAHVVIALEIHNPGLVMGKTSTSQKVSVSKAHFPWRYCWEMGGSVEGGASREVFRWWDGCHTQKQPIETWWLNVMWHLRWAPETKKRTQVNTTEIWKLQLIFINQFH